METICSKCGYQRKADDSGPAHVCPSCGIIYAMADPGLVPPQRAPSDRDIDVGAGIAQPIRSRPSPRLAQAHGNTTIGQLATGLLKNVLTGGKGMAGANNALLAELAIQLFTPEQKALVADAVVAMGVQASSFRESPDSFEDFFSRRERMQQLNCVALVLQSMGIPPMLPGASWMPIANPFTLPTTKVDIETSAGHFRRKYGIDVAVSNESINLNEWREASGDGQASSLGTITCPTCSTVIAREADRPYGYTCAHCKTWFY